ncbi:MAG: hypothetical protein KKD74_14140 [Bacteroidetes bacterium]|nr:hypothetical protein [Bacteroidales bacterium]MBU1011271.1 hypothetical protein [Bacteroidota bacterium]
MADTSTLIAGIEFKIRKLVERQALLDEKVKGLEHENNSLKQTIAQQKETINQLTNQNNTNTIIQSLGREKESIEESRKKIRQVMHEIDFCLDLLNK